MTTLPMMFKQNNKGTLQVWQVSYEGNVIKTLYGQHGGKMQLTEDVIKKGKNIGRVNETTPEEQAALKAQQMYAKKVKEGYTTDMKLALEKKNVLEAIEPMLAFPIEKKEKYVEFPAVAQPKLDGMRCIAIIDEQGRCSLFSRTQKPINTLPHIVQQLEESFKSYQHLPIILDGELYNHELKEDFNKIISLIKRDEPHPEAEALIEYHIYDVVAEKPYLERVAHLKYGKLNKTKSLYLVPSWTVESREDLENAFHGFLEAGYEGAMYRNLNTPYEFKRSPGLLKVKVMQDDEFEIIGVLEGNGKLAGHAGSFICQTAEGKVFKAKLKGEIAALKEYFENFDAYKGKLLTVQYQGITPDGVPRFPVGLRIRVEE